MPFSTVKAPSMLDIDYRERKVIEKTESGWPTVITGTHANGQSDFGIAINSPGKWHEKTPVQEIDLYLTEDPDWQWTIVVVFDDVELAESEGHYHTHGYDGSRSISWTEVEDGPPLHLTEENITPILHFEDFDFGIDGFHIPVAYAFQRTSNFGILERMFDLPRYDTLMQRKDQLWNRVVPREKRWENENTKLQDIGPCLDA